MLNWDNLKYFIAVARSGSVRSAAIQLNVNHTTVSRRINNFEKQLGQRLFERSNKGYQCTRFGNDILQEALALEKRLHSVERLAASENQSMTGDIRITLPDILAEHLLLPAFANFCESYPDISLEIIDSTKRLNLAQREADIAIRICDKAPDTLIGRRIAVLHRACYVAAKFASKIHDKNWLAKQCWLGWTDKMRRPVGQIAREYPRFGSRHKISNSLLQINACKRGMGIGVLPCFYGDLAPELIRIPPFTSEAKYPMWLLCHADMRGNAKLETFQRYITQYLLERKDLLEGRGSSH